MPRSRPYPFPRAEHIGTAEIAIAIKSWEGCEGCSLKRYKNAVIQVHPRWVHTVIGDSFEGIRVVQTQSAPEHVPSVRIAFD